jgi:hypothetical protein
MQCAHKWKDMNTDYYVRRLIATSTLYDLPVSMKWHIQKIRFCIDRSIAVRPGPIDSFSPEIKDTEHAEGSICVDRNKLNHVEASPIPTPRTPEADQCHVIMAYFDGEPTSSNGTKPI